ncbi:hypothetical protein CCH79_00019174 [Gambusia affinis]|uniref:Phosphatidylinositol-4-phosphate 3-kinase n=1 Tax=Gambusia affinis TaxID=33528 RepID=A0A315UMY0_GAMAF|nr:hypothetical protein CCH79_00019174 [Gambusia affinis]
MENHLLIRAGFSEDPVSLRTRSQTLAGLEFVQQCLKFDWDIRLFLTKRSAVNTKLARTKEDDDTPSSMNHCILLQERPIKQTVTRALIGRSLLTSVSMCLTREALTLLLDTFHNEAESFLLSEVTCIHIFKDKNNQELHTHTHTLTPSYLCRSLKVELLLHVERLVQSVKALCSSLAAVETPDVTAALNQLPACPCRLQPKVLKVSGSEVLRFCSRHSEDASVLSLRENRGTNRTSDPQNLFHLSSPPAELVVEKLTAAILDLVELYCSTFNANFHTAAQSRSGTVPVQEAGLVTNVLSFNVYAAHRVPITWATRYGGSLGCIRFPVARYEGFFLSCSLTHGGAELCAPQHTSKQGVSKYLFHLVVWDQRAVCLATSLFYAMLSCGIPELSDLDDLKYVYDALRPHESEADATTYFTRLIESSLGSVATKLNFFIHNLAQMKFASSEDRPVLSFAPRIHTARSDGVIKNLYICRHIRSANKGYVSMEALGRDAAGLPYPNPDGLSLGLQAFVVKVERDAQQEAQLVQRTFEEFQELHSKLRLVFPSSKLPSFPSRFVIGRSRSEATADRRKDELNGYVWHLIHAAPEVAQGSGGPVSRISAVTHHCDLVYTFFHPLSRDERTAGGSSKPAEVLWSPAAGTELGEVKLSISYKNDKLLIMVIHIRGLLPLQDGTDPDPYVKLYLLPDPQKTGKRKTKAARRTCNPTYNEMLVYDRIPRGDLDQRVIHLRVLSDGSFWENTLLGETFIPLTKLVPGQHWIDWHRLVRTGSDSAH